MALLGLLEGREVRGVVGGQGYLLFQVDVELTLRGPHETNTEIAHEFKRMRRISTDMDPSRVRQ